MKPVTISVFVLIALSALSYPVSAQNQFHSIITSLFGKAADTLFESGPTEFLDNHCQYSVRPTFNKWQLFYKAKFSCPGLAPFTGTSKTRSKAGAISAATKNFAQKALNANLFDRSELSLWL